MLNQYMENNLKKEKKRWIRRVGAGPGVSGTGWGKAWPSRYSRSCRHSPLPKWISYDGREGGEREREGERRTLPS